MLKFNLITAIKFYHWRYYIFSIIIVLDLSLKMRLQAFKISNVCTYMFTSQNSNDIRNWYTFYVSPWS